MQRRRVKAPGAIWLQGATRQALGTVCAGPSRRRGGRFSASAAGRGWGSLFLLRRGRLSLEGRADREQEVT